MKIFAALIVFALHSVALGQNICFPLQVGTRWQFQGQPLAEYQPSAPKEIIKDTIMENGKKYSVLLYDGAALPEYIRAQNDSVFVYSIYEKQESLAYRFNANEKDTVAIRIRGNDTTDVILIDTTIAKIFGKSVRQFKFLIDVRHYIDDERGVTIADSIGVTRISDAFGYVSSIQGAFINGTKFGTITSVNRAQTVPSRFGLSQNYPNPFNPATTIRFSLTEGARVRLVIFDCTGREVAELVSATLPPGEHMRIWDASKMSSGVYFYRLQAGAYAETRRMVLIR